MSYAGFLQIPHFRGVRHVGLFKDEGFTGSGSRNESSFIPRREVILSGLLLDPDPKPTSILMNISWGLEAAGVIGDSELQA